MIFLQQFWSEISSMTLNVAELDWVVGTELWIIVEAVDLSLVGGCHS